MDERNNQSSRHSYENGSTRPPKSHGGTIALVICAVIFLCGIFTARNFWRANQQTVAESTGPISFSNTGSTNPDETNSSNPLPSQTAPESGEKVDIELSPNPGPLDNVPQTGGLGLQEIYEKNIPSVVSITCAFSGGSKSGTGVVLSENGYLVTNDHVVSGAQSIEVLFTDGRTLPASIVGTDGLSDLAVLYVEAADLIPAEFGDSSALRVGDAVVAIGDPLGVSFRGTMTDGIVSAINRDVQSDGRTMTLIQTNAALNSGNSGGPLINCYGQVIGINTMKIGAFADDAGVEGLGFAIPSVTVKEVVGQLIAQGYVSGRPSLNLEGQWVSAWQQSFRRMPAGLYITQAVEDYGIQAGDILLYVDGSRVTKEDELQSVLYSHRAGDAVELVLYRNGYQYSVDFPLTEVGK